MMAALGLVAFLVSCIDELEEQIAAAGNNGQVTDFVDDTSEKRQKNLIFFQKGALALGLGKRLNEITGGWKMAFRAGLDGLDAERERQMALSCSGRAKEVYNFTTIDELQLGERHDAVFVERGLGCVFRRSRPPVPIEAGRGFR